MFQGQIIYLRLLYKMGCFIDFHDTKKVIISHARLSILIADVTIIAD